MLHRNLDVSSGLVNGAQGTVVDFLWPAKQSDLPHTVLVKFDDPHVGGPTRWSLYEGDIECVAIRPFRARFTGKHGRGDFVRYQFPLVPSWAMTIHKAQGLTLDKAVIDLGSSVFAHGQAYVALSRLRTQEGLLLTGLSRLAFQRTDYEVKTEMKRVFGNPMSWCCRHVRELQLCKWGKCLAPGFVS